MGLGYTRDHVLERRCTPIRGLFYKPGGCQCYGPGVYQRLYTSEMIHSYKGAVSVIGLGYTRDCILVR